MRNRIVPQRNSFLRACGLLGTQIDFDCWGNRVSKAIPCRKSSKVNRTRLSSHGACVGERKNSKCNFVNPFFLTIPPPTYMLVGFVALVYESRTKLIATITKEKFGFDTKPLADLIHWGDITDGAQYPTPQSAVELAEPATQLALVIEAAPENGLPAKIIPELAYRPLSEMVKLPLVAKHLEPLLKRHRKSIEKIGRASCRERV